MNHSNSRIESEKIKTPTPRKEQVSPRAGVSIYFMSLERMLRRLTTMPLLLAHLAILVLANFFPALLDD